jgi:hypothetical protein
MRKRIKRKCATLVYSAAAKEKGKKINSNKVAKSYNATYLCATK